MKKSVLLFLILLMFTAGGFTQSPGSFKYQAVARDAAGAILANKSVSFRISLRLGIPTGSVLFSETHTATTNAFGLVNLEIGKGTAETGTLLGLDWSTGPWFVQVEMDPEGGTNYQLLGTSQLQSVPYALHANTVSKGDDWGDQSAITDETIVGTGSPVSPLAIAQQDAKIGQSLQWNGETWRPGNNLAIGGSEGHVQFNSGGSLAGDPSLYWDNRGKRLGIGTEAPFGDLDIRGSYHAILNLKAPYDAILRVDRTLTDRWATINFLDNGNSRYWVGLNGNNKFSISTSSTLFNGLEVRENGDVGVSNNLLVNLNGRIGIGVENPVYPLEIMTSSTSYIRFFHSLSGTGNTDGLLMGMQQGGNQAWLWNYEDGPVHIGTNNTYRLSVKATGEVGIGTYDPQAQLQVLSDTNVQFPHLLLTESGPDYGRLMFKNTSAPTKNWTIAGYLDDSDLASRLNFFYSNGTTGSDLLTLTGNGRLTQPKTGDAHLLPIAYGNINNSATIISGTNNISCTWNDTAKQYEITITGESYHYSSYTTIITAISSTPIIANTGSVGGKLLVKLYNMQGTAVQGIFNFVTYKQ
jgi:hypothetical protein